MPVRRYPPAYGIEPRYSHIVINIYSMRSVSNSLVLCKNTRY